MPKISPEIIAQITSELPEGSRFAVHVVYKHTVLKRVPQELSQEVGRIVTRYSYLEHLINQGVYKILGIGEASARIAVREPPLKDRIDMIRDLISINSRKGLSSTIDLVKLSSRIGSLSNQRNLLAHSIWVKDAVSGTIHIRVTNSSTAVFSNPTKRVKKKILPEYVPVNKLSLRETRLELDSVIEVCEELLAEVSETLESYKRRCLEQLRTSCK